jgi:DNA-binding NtrC family response regulator
MDGLDAIPRCRELAPDTPIIVMTAHGTRQTAMDAITRGAYDFFTKPLKMDEFQVVVARALDRRRLQKQVKGLRDSQPSGLEGLIGQSETLKRVVDMAHRAAPTDLTILVQGESGTGKEVLARAIHRLSVRKDGPFVPLRAGQGGHPLPGRDRRHDAADPDQGPAGAAGAAVRAGRRRRNHPDRRPGDRGHEPRPGAVDRRRPVQE